MCLVIMIISTASQHLIVVSFGGCVCLIYALSIAHDPHPEHWQRVFEMVIIKLFIPFERAPVALHSARSFDYLCSRCTRACDALWKGALVSSRLDITTAITPPPPLVEISLIDSEDFLSANITHAR